MEGWCRGTWHKISGYRSRHCIDGYRLQVVRTNGLCGAERGQRKWKQKLPRFSFRCYTKAYTDTITGTKQERPGLEAALSHLREGDTFVVWRLDRLGRSLKHLIETVTALQKQHIGFKSITENIDTATATGQ
ncbi:MAG TPA: recombinase family protein, partial [Gammaproteobacteria bacterium]|nr:recombinase family protein [Gammaproteobacteria bacterium]